MVKNVLTVYGSKDRNQNVKEQYMGVNSKRVEHRREMLMLGQ